MQNTIDRYEGHEKKIDLMLSAPLNGLRDNHDGRWERVVEASLAKIISKISTRHLDAYLLSESSLFVWDDRIVMMTCGQTRLIDAIPEMIRITGHDRIARLLYERKHPVYPREQPASFEKEVTKLETYFPGRYDRLGPKGEDHIHLFQSSPGAGNEDRGLLLQLLMYDLAPSVIDLFITPSEKISELKTIPWCAEEILPGVIWDSHFFSPAGFSMNGISGDTYLTIHVTPQKNSSYSSFETNMIFSDFPAVVRNVISLFKPGRFSLGFTSKTTPLTFPESFSLADLNRVYHESHRSRQRFDDGCEMIFLNYSCSRGQPNGLK